MNLNDLNKISALSANELEDLLFDLTKQYGKLTADWSKLKNDYRTLERYEKPTRYKYTPKEGTIEARKQQAYNDTNYLKFIKALNSAEESFLQKEGEKLYLEQAIENIRSILLKRFGGSHG